MKLLDKDVIIKEKRQQVMDAILSQFESIEKFEQYTNIKNINSYLAAEKTSDSEFFDELEYNIIHALRYTYDELFIPVDCQVISLVDKIYYNIKEYDSPQDIMIFDKLKKLCIEHNVSLCKMYFIFGMYYYQTGNADMAYEYLSKSVKTPCEDYNLIIEANSLLGYLLFSAKEFNKARFYYQQAEEIILSKKGIRNKLLFQHYYRKGTLENSVAGYDIALKSFFKAMEYASDVWSLGSTIMNIGLVYKRQNLLQKALEYFFDSLKIFDKNDKNSIGMVYNNIAEALRLAGVLNCALEYVYLALECYDDDNCPDRLVSLDTFYKIKVAMNHELDMDKLIGLIADLGKYSSNGRFIGDAIQNVMEYGIRNGDKRILIKLKTSLKKLIRNFKNECEYKHKLKSYLCDVYEVIYARAVPFRKKIC
ncbi:MAG: tetratricopeptide repeat protein [Bacillota bacterium]